MIRPQVEAVDIDLKTGSTLGFYTYGEDRPNLLIVSGTTGRSATDVYASYLIMKHLESLDRVDGSVTIVPVANPLVFRLGAAVSPLDMRDLETVFPGDKRGTVTEKTARELWRHATQADAIVVLKTNWPSCISHTVALYKEYIHVRNLASQIALPLVVQSLGQQGSLSAEAAHEGIPAVDIELRGGRDQVDSQAAVEVREAILNYMRIRDMIPGERIESSPVFTGRMQQLNAESEGFFIPRMNVGEPVQADDVIGTVQDKGDLLSPHAGVVVMLSTLSYVFEGDVVARIAPPASEQKNHTEPVFERTPTVRRKW